MLMRARKCIVSLKIFTLAENIAVTTSAGFQPGSSALSVGETSAHRRRSLRQSGRVALTALEASPQSQFRSVAQSCPSPCDPKDGSTPGFHVPHQLPELTQTHVHRAGDAIQPSHPLSSPSPPSFNLSQHQSLFQWVSSSHQVTKVLELQLQHQSFQWIFRTDFL